MARGMVVGEKIVSQAMTKEYEKNHARIFGEPDPDFPRGVRFIWDPVAKELVPATGTSERVAVNAPILSGRFYENTAATDGADIGSRKRHRDYMKRNNLAMHDDFKGDFSKAAKEREAIRNGDYDRKGRREDVARALYQTHKP